MIQMGIVGWWALGARLWRDREEVFDRQHSCQVLHSLRWKNHKTIGLHHALNWGQEQGNVIFFYISSNGFMIILMINHILLK